MKEQAAAIDLIDVEVEGLAQPESARVDGREAHTVGGRVHRREHAPDFVPTEDDGQLAIPFGARDVEDRPAAP